MIDMAHIHPMLVHFPLALLPIALVTQAVALTGGGTLFSRTCSAKTGMLLLLLAAAGAILAAVFGDIAFDRALESGVPMSAMEDHEELGTLSAIALGGLAAVEVWLYARNTDSRMLSAGFLLAGVVVLATVLTTAWFGGQLVYDLGVNVTRSA